MPLRLTPPANLLAALAICALPVVLFGCAKLVPEPREVTGHVDQPSAAAASSPIPRPVTRLPSPPPPSVEPPSETYTVVVNGVPVRELLFALARDAAINVDIHPDIEGNVTLNAIDQSLPQILERLTRQVDLRYELNDNLLVISPDEPFIRTYVVDYVNTARETTNTVNVSTQVATTSGGGDSGGEGDNNSTTSITGTSSHAIWETLVATVSAIVQIGRAHV